MLLQNLAACLLLPFLKKTRYLFTPCESIQPIKGSSTGKGIQVCSEESFFVAMSTVNDDHCPLWQIFREKNCKDSYIFTTKAALPWSASDSIACFIRQIIFVSAFSWFEIISSTVNNTNCLFYPSSALLQQRKQYSQSTDGYFQSKLLHLFQIVVLIIHKMKKPGW